MTKNSLLGFLVLLLYVYRGICGEILLLSKCTKWPHGNRYNRAAGDGHWRASGKDVPIFSNIINGGMPLMVGLKKTLVF